MSEAEKREHFDRALKKRRTAIIQMITKLANLRNESYYAANDKELDRSIKMIKSALKNTESILTGK